MIKNYVWAVLWAAIVRGVQMNYGDASLVGSRDPMVGLLIGPYSRLKCARHSSRAANGWLEPNTNIEQVKTR